MCSYVSDTGHRMTQRAAEDVRQFEKAVVAGPRTKRSGKLSKKEERSDDEELSDIPVKRKVRQMSHVALSLLTSTSEYGTKPDHDFLGRSE